MSFWIVFQGSCCVQWYLLLLLVFKVCLKAFSMFFKGLLNFMFKAFRWFFDGFYIQ